MYVKYFTYETQTCNRCYLWKLLASTRQTKASALPPVYSFVPKSSKLISNNPRARFVTDDQ